MDTFFFAFLICKMWLFSCDLSDYTEDHVDNVTYIREGEQVCNRMI